MFSAFFDCCEGATLIRLFGRPVIEQLPVSPDVTDDDVLSSYCSVIGLTMRLRTLSGWRVACCGYAGYARSINLHFDGVVCVVFPGVHLIQLRSLTTNIKVRKQQFVRSLLQMSSDKPVPGSSSMSQGKTL